MPIYTVWILKYVQQYYVKWFWTISSLGAPGTPFWLKPCSQSNTSEVVSSLWRAQWPAFLLAWIVSLALRKLQYRSWLLISCCQCTFMLTSNVRRVIVNFKLGAYTRRTFFSPCVLVSYELSWLSCYIYRLHTICYPVRRQRQFYKSGRISRLS